MEQKLYNELSKEDKEVRKELEDRLFKKIYYLDHRKQCDECLKGIVTFGICLEDDSPSEDHYCLDCLYKTVYKELYPDRSTNDYNITW